MTTIVLLFAIGTVLFFFEVIVPGAILGILGGLAMLAGCVLAFIEYGPNGGLLAALAAATILGICLYVELRILPRTRAGRRMFLDASLQARSQPPVADPAVVGRTCEAITPLAPTGFVTLDGRKFEAFSQSGFVEKGEKLTVAAVDNFRLIVHKS